MPTSWHKYSKYSRGNYLNSEPVLRATSPVTTYTRNALSQKSREAASLSWVRIKENKPKGKIWTKKRKLNRKKCAKKTKMVTSRFKPTPWPPSTRETSSKTNGPRCRWITNRSQVFANRRMFMFVNALKKVSVCMPQDQKQVRVCQTNTPARFIQGSKISWRCTKTAFRSWKENKQCSATNVYE